MDDSPLYSLVLFIIFVIFNGLLYGFGEAVRKINETDVEKDAEEGDRRSIKIKRVIDKPDKFINTVHVVTGATACMVGFFQLRAYGDGCRQWLADKIGMFVIDQVVLVAAYLMVGIYLMFLVISLGIIVPKKLGAKYSEKTARGLVGFVTFAMWVLTPITAIVSLFAGIVLRLMGIDPNEELLNVTEEEIISMVNEGHEQGVLEEREAEMISNIIELDDKTAGDIMVHRKNIVAVDGTWTLKEAVDFIINQNYSRFPVYLDSIDNIIGVIHLRNAMAHYYNGMENDKQVSQIQDILMEAKFIPESRNVDDLFKDMQLNKTHMEIVVDEYGQTSGIIAMEDILEEIVGNIFDEYDIEENNIVQEAENVYLVKGMTTLEEMEDVLEDEFDDEDYDTLNGYLISKLDRIPSEDENPELVINNFNYKILSVENKTISLVRITRISDEEDEEIKNEENVI